MFLGTWAAPIDDTGHMRLPVSYHTPLRDGIVVTRGFDGCLQGFSLAAWLGFAQRVSALPLGNAEARSLRRLLFGGASQAQLDERGRIALAPELRRYAQLGDGAIIAGLSSYFEIWSPGRWRAETQRFQRLSPSQFDLSLPVRAADASEMGPPRPRPPHTL